MSFPHHEEDIALKSPVIADKDGLRFLCHVVYVVISLAWGTINHRFNHFFIIIIHF